MSFVMIVAASGAMFLPKSISYTSFDSMANCQTALYEAKKRWQTIDAESTCIDLEKTKHIKEVEEALRRLKQP